MYTRPKPSVPPTPSSLPLYGPEQLFHCKGRPLVVRRSVVACPSPPRLAARGKGVACRTTDKGFIQCRCKKNSAEICEVLYKCKIRKICTNSIQNLKDNFNSNSTIGGRCYENNEFVYGF